MITINDIDTQLYGRKHINDTEMCSDIIPDDTLRIEFDNDTWAQCCFDESDRNVLLITIFVKCEYGIGEQIEDYWHDFSRETEEQGIEDLYIQLLELAGIE